MDHKEIINKFYSSFAAGNSKGMVELYHKDIIFQDPVFGKLKGERVVKMWEMLLSKKKEDTKISFDNIQASAETAQAKWVAVYYYGESKRKVINKVTAHFKFKDGLIIEHIDTFDLWKWTQQALGILGYLIGWTPFMKNKIQNSTNENLNKFIASNHA